MDGFKYNDILHYKYPNLEIENDFPDKILRAAQFAPFAALTGYDDAVEETARLTDRKLELDDYAKEELNRKLIYMAGNPDSGQLYSVTYFVPDSKKSGGAYVTKTGTVVKVREYEKDVVFEDGTEIPVEDILEIADC